MEVELILDHFEAFLGEVHAQVEKLCVTLHPTKMEQNLHGIAGSGYSL